MMTALWLMLGWALGCLAGFSLRRLCERDRCDKRVGMILEEIVGSLTAGESYCASVVISRVDDDDEDEDTDHPVVPRDLVGQQNWREQ